MFSTWLGMVLLFAFFGLLALVLVKASPRGSNYEKKRAEARMKKLEDAQKENLTALNSYAWVDKNKGTARIPIDHAIGIMLVELADKKPSAAGPIAAASPSPVPQTPPAAATNPSEIPLTPPSAEVATTDSEVTTRDVEQVERALIDASTRLPVLFFYASAIVWLLLGTLLAGLVSWKLHAPDLLANWSWLTWGRLRPVHMNVMVYGWASMAGIGTAIWLMARLCRTTLRHPLLLISGAAFWNLGVLLGVGGILAGDSTGYEWLEFPPYAAVVLFVAYSLVVSWAMLMFRFRRGEHIYITQWYLLGAFLWFPWVYAAGQLMIFVVPVQGVLQAAVGWWYANNLLFLWFGAIGLGTAYYMIPKVIGRPVYSYHLATIGFW